MCGIASLYRQALTMRPALPISFRLSLRPVK
jgi:hypothetical protein